MANPKRRRPEPEAPRARSETRFLVLQHIPVEHPGVFRDFFARDGVHWDAVELDAGAVIPPLAGYHGLWVMGGPMDVWEEERYPWLVEEKQVIRTAVVDRQLPFLGFCLGHQLLATALDGRAAPMQQPEIGIRPVSLTAAGRTDALFQGVAADGKCLQWHGVEVTRVPSGATVLARSDACAVQAFRVGAHAYGIQYHVEITRDTVREWGAVPAYQASLDRVLGPGSLAPFQRDALAQLQAFNGVAARIYENFMDIVAASQSRRGAGR